VPSPAAVACGPGERAGGGERGTPGAGGVFSGETHVLLSGGPVFRRALGCCTVYIHAKHSKTFYKANILSSIMKDNKGASEVVWVVGLGK
jgi:hypothetical protein